MSTRLDAVLKKFPDHADGIRALAACDPAGNLKYLDWSARVLASGQALAPEIADVVDLFHKLSVAVRRPRKNDARVHSDINTYGPQDFTGLRDSLLKLKRAQDRKRRKRERLYQIDGSLEVEVVYDGPDLVVRHIKNKQASVHYGLRTKWCIAMLREGYFEDYSAQNATFFFLERKTPLGDEFDKTAIMVERGREMHTEVFTSLDHRKDMFSLVRVYGWHVFDIFRAIYFTSTQYPGSATACVYAGTATAEQVQATFDSFKRDRSRNRWDTHDLIVSICCNDAAPFSLLEEVARVAPKLAAAAWRRTHRRKLQEWKLKDLERTIASALFIHPNTPADEREALGKELRKRRVKIDSIFRADEAGRIGVSYGLSAPARSRAIGHGRRYRRHLRYSTAKALRKRAEMLDRSAARMRARATKLELRKKIADAKKGEREAKKK